MGDGLIRHRRALGRRCTLGFSLGADQGYNHRGGRFVLATPLFDPAPPARARRRWPVSGCFTIPTHVEPRGPMLEAFAAASVRSGSTLAILPWWGTVHMASSPGRFLNTFLPSGPSRQFLDARPLRLTPLAERLPSLDAEHGRHRPALIPCGSRHCLLGNLLAPPRFARIGHMPTAGLSLRLRTRPQAHAWGHAFSHVPRAKAKESAFPTAGHFPHKGRRTSLQPLMYA